MFSFLAPPPGCASAHTRRSARQPGFLARVITGALLLAGLAWVLVPATSLGASGSAEPAVCRADCDGDGRVDLTDFGMMSRSFAPGGCEACACDTDLDGDIDITDYNVLSREFGRTDCPYIPRVLLLHDGITESTDGLLLALQSEGAFSVKYSEVDETAWDGTNPSLDDTDVVIHLNSNTFNGDMPTSGQLALEDFVHAGGGYVGSEWTSLRARYWGHYADMDDLRLFDYVKAECGERTTYTTPTADGHPVVDGVDGEVFDGCFSHVTPREFDEDAVVVLMQSSIGLPTVATRRVGDGYVIGLDLAMNHRGGIYDLGSSAAVQQLYTNSVRWLADSPEDTGGTPSGAIPPATITVTFGGIEGNYVDEDGDLQSCDSTQEFTLDHESEGDGVSRWITDLDTHLGTDLALSGTPDDDPLSQIVFMAPEDGGSVHYFNVDGDPSEVGQASWGTLCGGGATTATLLSEYNLPHCDFSTATVTLYAADVEAACDPIPATCELEDAYGESVEASDAAGDEGECGDCYMNYGYCECAEACVVCNAGLYAFIHAIAALPHGALAAWGALVMQHGWQAVHALNYDEIAAAVGVISGTIVLFRPWWETCQKCYCGI
jgi:hypothetical protein